MNDHEHIPLDAALEALARPDVPREHVAQVLARTAGRAGSPSRPSAHAAVGEGGSRPSPSLRPRWILPIAATLVAVLGGAWLGERAMQTRLDMVMRMEPDALPLTAGSESRPYPGDGTPIDLPVLPPEAYWGMDPFEEFARLRPGTGHRAPTVGRRTASAWSRAAAPVAQGAWAMETLPAIELDAIETAPIDIAPLAPLDDITVTEITLAPIVIAPVDAQEKP